MPQFPVRIGQRGLTDDTDISTIAVKSHPWALMTRDNELIRQIMLAIRARKDTSPQALEIEGADKATVARHLEMLLDIGLLEGEKLGVLNALYPTILVKDLSWSGHDLAAVMENETVWGQFQQKLSPSQLVQIPLPVLKTVGIGLLTTWLKSQF